VGAAASWSTTAEEEQEAAKNIAEGEKKEPEVGEEPEVGGGADGGGILKKVQPPVMQPVWGHRWCSRRRQGSEGPLWVQPPAMRKRGRRRLRRRGKRPRKEMLVGLPSVPSAGAPTEEEQEAAEQTAATRRREEGGGREIIATFRSISTKASVQSYPHLSFKITPAKNASHDKGICK
jgi:hypothetical protein